MRDVTLRSNENLLHSGFDDRRVEMIYVLNRKKGQSSDLDCDSTARLTPFDKISSTSTQQNAKIVGYCKATKN